MFEPHLLVPEGHSWLCAQGTTPGSSQRPYAVSGAKALILCYLSNLFVLVIFDVSVNGT